jgi:glutamate-1-semialdehyde aminotransferase
LNNEASGGLMDCKTTFERTVVMASVVPARATKPERVRVVASGTEGEMTWLMLPEDAPRVGDRVRVTVEPA